MANYRTEVGGILQGSTTSPDVLATQVDERQRLRTVESLAEMTEIVAERGPPISCLSSSQAAPSPGS